MLTVRKYMPLAVVLGPLAAGACGSTPPEDAPAPVAETRSALAATGNVLTQHNDNARTGAYTAETVLTPSNVGPGSFGPIFRRRVRGNIVTQPLYVNALATTTAGTKNAVIVATNTNQIYAFDADSSSPHRDAGLLWPVIDLGATDLQPVICPEVAWVQGISSTPAIDKDSSMMYVVARLGVTEHRLFKIDLTKGTVNSSVAISSSGASVPWDFDPSRHANRPGLLLQGGNVYIAFATRQCDADPYQGWVFSYSASTLARQGVFTTASQLRAGATAKSAYAGIWQSGSGLVGDDTSVYMNTGNVQRASGSSLSNSVLKLSGSTLALSARFQDPIDDRLNCGDTDLASGGPVLLPGPTILSGGKQGKVHVLNPATMTSLQGSVQLTYDTYHLPGQHPVNCFPAGHPVDPTDCFHDPYYGQNCVLRESDYPWSEHLGPNIHGAPAYFATGATSGVFFTFGEKDFLRGYPYSSTTRQLTCAAGAMSCNSTLTSPTIRAPEGMPGGFISVSSNGTSNGIVWALVERVDGQLIDNTGTNVFGGTPDNGKKVTSWLIAANASTLVELYRDQVEYPFVKFVPPTIANGKVYRATMSATDTLNNPESYLVAYGPLKTQNRWTKIQPAINALVLQ